MPFLVNQISYLIIRLLSDALDTPWYANANAFLYEEVNLQWLAYSMACDTLKFQWKARL